VPRTTCIRLDAAVFNNVGAAEDDEGDMETLGRFKDGEGWAKGLAEGWTEAVRLTCSALGLLASFSRAKVWGARDRFLFSSSSAWGGLREVLLSASCDARVGGVIPDEDGMAAGCDCVKFHGRR
jgi:hypothetical protein